MAQGLMIDVPGDAAGPSAGASTSTAAAAAAGSSAAVANGVGVDAVAALRAENAALRTRLAAVMAAALPDELLGGAAAGGLDLGGPAAARGAGGSSSSGSDSGSESGDEGVAAGGKARGGRGVVVPAGRKGAKVASTAARIDAAYFESYSYFDIHREMLGDKVRRRGGAGREDGAGG
jgi:hypothetical protein